MSAILFTDVSYGRGFAKDPAVAYYRGGYFLYYSVFDTAHTLHIGIARSKDGENWTKYGELPITQSCEANGIGAPGVIIVDGRLHMFYQTYGNGKNDAICRAVSDDGLNFEKDPSNPVFSPTTDWCCVRAIDADLCRFGDRIYLYFATRSDDFKIQKLGCASAAAESDFSRGCWRQEKNSPTLEPKLEWEGECIEAPAAIAHDGRVWLFYGGAYNCSPQMIGCAVSDDGVDFTRIADEPLLRNGGAGDWNRSESGHPYAFEDVDGSCWLYYQGSPDDGKSWYLSRAVIIWTNGEPSIDAGESTGLATTDGKCGVSNR